MDDWALIGRGKGLRCMGSSGYFNSVAELVCDLAAVVAVTVFISAMIGVCPDVFITCSMAAPVTAAAHR